MQVHPDDAFARREENDNGKTEMWYIVQADEGAGIYCGFRRDTGREEFLQRVADGTVEELLNFIPVKAGDCYLIKAGTVHAIGAGCVICEVQQSSNVTYRVYDYNRRGADGQAASAACGKGGAGHQLFGVQRRNGQRRAAERCGRFAAQADRMQVFFLP